MGAIAEEFNNLGETVSQEVVTIPNIVTFLKRAMIVILIIVIALVAWSLHLMESAINEQEFSLMLAGILVAGAAAAMVAVYFLMGSYVGYLNETAQFDGLTLDAMPRESLSWLVELDAAQSSWTEMDSISPSSKAIVKIP